MKSIRLVFPYCLAMTFSVRLACAEDLPKDPAVVTAETAAALQAAQNLLEDLKAKSQLQELENAKNIATLNATIAAQEKATREATFGATLTPRDGSIAVTSSAEATLIANARLANIANAICLETDRFKRRRVYLTTGFPDPALQFAVQTYPLIEKDVSEIITTFRKEIPLIHQARVARPPEDEDTGSASILAAAGTAQAVLSVAALARVNRDYSGVTVTADNNAFLATMFNAFERLNFSPQYGLFSEKPSAMIALFVGLASASSEAESEVAEATAAIKNWQTELDTAKKERDAQKRIIRNPASTEDEKIEAEASRGLYQAKIDRLELFIPKFAKSVGPPNEKLVALGKRATDYLTGLEKGKIMGVDVTKLNEAQYVRAALEGDSAFILYVNVNNVAGTNLKKQTLLTNSFQAGAGASVSYVAIGPFFKTLAADTIYDYKGFYTVKDERMGRMPVHPSLTSSSETRPDEETTVKKIRTGPRSK